MALRFGGVASGYIRGKPKRTSQSTKKRSVKMTSMNKHKKRSYKIYNKQGR